jgi:Na+-driven multidrug efflux pump
MLAEKRNLTIFTLSWPIFIELFLRLLMGNVNVLMLSHYSDKAVGAVGVSAQILNMLVMLYSIVGTGTAIVISQYIGAGMKDSASKAAKLAVGINLVFGIFISILMVLFSRYILVAMNT